MRILIAAVLGLAALVAAPEPASAQKRSTLVGAGAGALAGAAVAGPAGAVDGGVAGGYAGSKYRGGRRSVRPSARR